LQYLHTRDGRRIGVAEIKGSCSLCVDIVYNDLKYIIRLDMYFISISYRLCIYSGSIRQVHEIRNILGSGAGKGKQIKERKKKNGV
jgi:hypothetical protein